MKKRKIKKYKLVIIIYLLFIFSGKLYLFRFKLNIKSIYKNKYIIILIKLLNFFNKKN